MSPHFQQAPSGLLTSLWAARPEEDITQGFDVCYTVPKFRNCKQGSPRCVFLAQRGREAAEGQALPGMTKGLGENSGLPAPALAALHLCLPKHLLAPRPCLALCFQTDCRPPPPWKRAPFHYSSGQDLSTHKCHDNKMALSQQRD